MLTTGWRVLDVAFVAAVAFPPKRRRALLDELEVATFFVPLPTVNFRALPYLTFFATDASPSTAGACSSAVFFGHWTKLYYLSEDRGESVRFGWDSCPPVETELRDSRAFAAFQLLGTLMCWSWRL